MLVYGARLYTTFAELHVGIIGQAPLPARIWVAAP